MTNTEFLYKKDEAKALSEKIFKFEQFHVLYKFNALVDEHLREAIAIGYNPISYDEDLHELQEQIQRDPLSISTSVKKGDFSK